MKDTHHRKCCREHVFAGDAVMLSYFDSCSMQRKTCLLLQRGDFVLDIRYYRHKVSLYIFYGCYVEMFYEPKGNRIEKIAPLDEKHLAFYADQIKLPVGV